MVENILEEGRVGTLSKKLIQVLMKSWEYSFLFPQYQSETQRKQVEQDSFENVVVV